MIDYVTEINHEAFYGCNKLQNINIPDGLTNFGAGVFYKCDNLKLNEYDNALYLGNNKNKYVILIKAVNKDIESCSIHQNTKYIDDRAFLDCSKLSSIELPDKVTQIGTSSFENCTALSNVVLPDDFTQIDVKAFKNCRELVSINIPDELTWLGGSAFSGCIKLIQKENGISYVGKWIIGCQSNEANITIRNDTVGIAADAHIRSNNDQIITIPDSIKYIFQDGIQQRVKYNGTKQQWLNRVSTPFNFEVTIQCSDGNIKYYGGKIVSE